MRRNHSLAVLVRIFTAMTRVKFTTCDARNKENNLTVLFEQKTGLLADMK